MKKLKKGGSWRTTIAGVVIACGLLGTQVGFLIDNDPKTSVDWSVVMVALGALGFGASARDDKVSSEDAGAK